MLFPQAGRIERLPLVERGEAPGEFFYGGLGLRQRGYGVDLVDTQSTPNNAFGKLMLRYDIVRNRILRHGYSLQRVAATRPALATADVAISMTDGFTLGLGLAAPSLRPRPILCGGFMGLSDIRSTVRPTVREWFDRRIKTALSGLDHVFFLSPGDREQAIASYDLAPEHTSRIDFGVDTGFWTPAEIPVPRERFVLTVGNDNNRDYDTLLSAGIEAPLTMVTRRNLKIPAGVEVTQLRGSLHNSDLDDRGLRELYRRAGVVVVPLHDVFQPSGQSVTLQAMACGAPVVLTQTRGLWKHEMLRTNETCMLVPPGDPGAIRTAAAGFLDNRNTAEQIGHAARDAVLAHASLEHMERDLKAMIERAMHAKGD